MHMPLPASKQDAEDQHEARLNGTNLADQSEDCVIAALNMIDV